MQPLAVADISDDTSTDFDLYIEVGDSLALYAAAPYKWSKAECDRLVQQGREKLYYGSADGDRVEAYRALTKLPPLPRESDPNIQIVHLTGAASELTRVLFEHPLSPAALEKGRDIAKALVETVSSDPKCVQALGLLARHDDYTYFHSARVAAYALAIALKLSAEDQSHLQEITLGCLLHDIGKSRIDLAVLNKPDSLTVREWDLIRKHPEFGADMIADSALPFTSSEIILHHHERMDGTGYPHNLKADELLDEVKIAAFADLFDALTTNRPYQQAMTRFKALDYIRHNLRKTVFDECFRAMVVILKDQDPSRFSS